jgi:hypothetical protein
MIDLYCFQFYILPKKIYGCNTIDMTSLYSQTRTENLKIEFPKTKLKTENINKLILISMGYFFILSLFFKSKNLFYFTKNTLLSTMFSNKSRSPVRGTGGVNESQDFQAS